MPVVFFNKSPEKIKALAQKSIQQYRQKWLPLSLRSKITLSLVASKFGEKEFAEKIRTSLKENAVINSEAGMYWKENTQGRFWQKDPIAIQALAIETFVENKKDIKTVEQLKTWLIKHKKTAAWESTKATTEAIYGLLMQGKNWLNETPQPYITIGNEQLHPESPEAKTGYFKKIYTPEEITPEKASIRIKNNAAIPQYGAMYWQYFEETDRVKKTEQKELKLRKQFFLKKEEKAGTVLVPYKNQTLEVGDLLTVRLTIKAKTDFSFMHLKDLRASGLEPVGIISKYKWQDGLGYYQSTRDVATHLFFEKLPKGTYIFDYDLRINNAGNFSSGITRLQNMYAPEFSVQSEGKRIRFEN